MDYPYIINNIHAHQWGMHTYLGVIHGQSILNYGLAMEFHSDIDFHRLLKHVFRIFELFAEAAQELIRRFDIHLTVHVLFVSSCFVFM